MTTASRTLAEFAISLRFEDIPAQVVERAKTCMIDVIGGAVYGSTMPWSRMILAYAQRNGAAGKCNVFGTDARLQPPSAALANGAFAHAFELDSMCQPSVGSHPGAALTPTALAVAQDRSKSGKDLITAFVAGCEVMYRIGAAAHHSSELLGFHAPGLLGVFGGAATASRLMGLDAGQMANAMGISGSLCSGLLEFSKSGGGMVKCLHLGRSNEGAIVAASLAADGYTGPPAIIEGKFGFLRVFGRDPDEARLTEGLGSVWHTMTTTLKCYACHSTSHVPVTAALALKEKHRISGEDIESIRVAGSEKLVSHHAIHEPQDIAMAQYSAPFNVALTFFRNPKDPAVFCMESVNHPGIRALCRKVTLELYENATKGNKLASRVTVRMRDGREFVEALEYYPGMPQRPFTVEQLREKFNILTAALPQERRQRFFEQFLALETAANVADLETV